METLAITGAAGWVGRHIVPVLREHYALRLIDVQSGDGIVHRDVTDLDALARTLAGADALLHLAAVAGDGDFEAEVVPKNIVGARNAFEAARLAGVRTVVFASSGQVVLNNPLETYVTADMPPRPTGPYAASKLFGEALARHYHDDHGMRTFCLRMGWLGPQLTDEMRADPVGWCWLSPRDLANIVVACLRSDRTFGIHFAASGGASGHWDLAGPPGWAPMD